MARIDGIGGNSIVDPTFTPKKMQAGAQRGTNSIVDPNFSIAKTGKEEKSIIDPIFSNMKAEAPREKQGIMQASTKTKNAFGGKFDFKA